LIAALGGRDAALEKLLALFEQPEKTADLGFVADATGLVGQYAHGNEPSHHVVYFFQYMNRPDRTAELVREVFDKFYLPKPDGLCGNDDCGQMSAWYIFSALGFYPFNPCGGTYVLGAPQIPKATVKLENGNTFTVIAENLSRDRKYVESAVLNGKPIDGFTIRHEDIVRGGVLAFKMGAGK
jgi:predicted alpha-1,2-mannosidase